MGPEIKEGLGMTQGGLDVVAVRNTADGVLQRLSVTVRGFGGREGAVTNPPSRERDIAMRRSHRRAGSKEVSAHLMKSAWWSAPS